MKYVDSGIEFTLICTNTSHFSSQASTYIDSFYMLCQKNQILLNVKNMSSNLSE